MNLKQSFIAIIGVVLFFVVGQFLLVNIFLVHAPVMWEFVFLGFQIQITAITLVVIILALVGLFLLITR